MTIFFLLLQNKTNINVYGTYYKMINKKLFWLNKLIIINLTKLKHKKKNLPEKRNEESRNNNNKVTNLLMICFGILDVESCITTKQYKQRESGNLPVLQTRHWSAVTKAKTTKNRNYEVKWRIADKYTVFVMRTNNTKNKTTGDAMLNRIKCYNNTKTRKTNDAKKREQGKERMRVKNENKKNHHHDTENKLLDDKMLEKKICNFNLSRRHHYINCTWMLITWTKRNCWIRTCAPHQTYTHTQKSSPTHVFRLLQLRTKQNLFFPSFYKRFVSNIKTSERWDWICRFCL